MAKKANKTKKTTAKSMVLSPVYRSRVVRDKTKYSRKNQKASSITAGE